MSRTEYEQQEFQRKNPHLYTTLNQCVNADGSITTFDDVTVKLRQTLDKMQEFHTVKHGGPHPDYCMKPLMFEKAPDSCAAIDYTMEELDKVRFTFVNNYKHMVDRMHYTAPPTTPGESA